MKHHYWEPPIALYLFLGGLAGGILFLSAIFNSFVIPGYGEIFAFPVLIALICVAIGCVFLIIDLGQPGVFWRVWTTATSIIKWGATFLVIAAVFLGVCLLGSLMLRTQMVQNSFEASQIETHITQLTQDVEDDQAKLDELDASLPSKAEEMGMVPQKGALTIDLNGYQANTSGDKTR